VKSSPIGDGRVYHGRKALEYGLVDHLGFLPDAVAFCEKSAGAEKGSFSVVQYEFNISFLNLLFSAESPVLRGINVKLPLPESQSAVLKPGRLYYLPGGM
jgi:ClpP class serine protease